MGKLFFRLPASPAELALQLIGDDRDGAPPDLACEQCGLEVIQPATGRPRTYCSERGRRDAFVARTAERSTLAA